jgi:hypothetical protein
MRQWLRSHLTYANVMVTLAVFLVFGGGTALAAYVVSSNSQIGPNTVSGHKPPSGDHANIIGGSINGTDLAANSVNGGKVSDGSLGPADLKSIVAKPRGNTAVSSGDSGPVSYPLSNNTWTQPVGEVELIAGSVTYTTPSSCSQVSDPAAFGHGVVNIQITGGAGGSAGAAAYLVALPSNTARSAPLVASPFVTAMPVPLFEPASNTAHTVSAQVSDTCDNAGENFVVSSVKIDIIGVR